jgi:hypothetical protein
MDRQPQLNNLKDKLLPEWWIGAKSNLAKGTNTPKRPKMERLFPMEEEEQDSKGKIGSTTTNGLRVWTNHLVMQRICADLSTMDRYALSEALVGCIDEDYLLRDLILAPGKRQRMPPDFFFAEHMGRIARILGDGLTINFNVCRVVMKNGLPSTVNSLCSTDDEVRFNCQYGWTFKSNYMHERFINVWYKRQWMGDSEKAKAFPGHWRELLPYLSSYKCNEFVCPMHEHEINGHRYRIVWSTIDLYGMSYLQLLVRIDFRGVLVAAQHSHQNVFIAIVHARTFFMPYHETERLDDDLLYAFILRCLKPLKSQPQSQYAALCEDNITDKTNNSTISSNSNNYRSDTHQLNDVLSPATIDGQQHEQQHQPEYDGSATDRGARVTHETNGTHETHGTHGTNGTNGTRENYGTNESNETVSPGTNATRGTTSGKPLRYTWTVTLLNKLQHNGWNYLELPKKMRIETQSVQVRQSSQLNHRCGELDCANSQESHDATNSNAATNSPKQMKATDVIGSTRTGGRDDGTVDIVPKNPYGGYDGCDEYDRYNRCDRPDGCEGYSADDDQLWLERLSTCCEKHRAPLTSRTSLSYSENATVLTMYEKQAREQMLNAKLCRLARLRRMHHALRDSDKLPAPYERFHAKIRTINKLMYRGRVTHAIQLSSPQQFLICDHRRAEKCFCPKQHKLRSIFAPVSCTRHDVNSQLTCSDAFPLSNESPLLRTSRRENAIGGSD